jgi:hypothetical protein
VEPGLCVYHISMLILSIGGIGELRTAMQLLMIDPYHLRWSVEAQLAIAEAIIQKYHIRKDGTGQDLP